MQDYAAAWLLQHMITHDTFAEAIKKNGELIGFWVLPLPGT
jgi:hypothetical protein